MRWVLVLVLVLVQVQVQVQVQHDHGLCALGVDRVRARTVLLDAWMTTARPRTRCDRPHLVSVAGGQRVARWCRAARWRV
jgi:hypothetical protein